MRIEWLNKKGNDRVIIFFNGWGMDGTIVSQLPASSDVVMFYDYRTLDGCSYPDLQNYGEIYLVAWSMGVWAASCVIPALKIRPCLSIAFNGTERPVDDQYGIPAKIYELTEKGMSERGREKFFARIFPTEAEKAFLMAHMPVRGLQDQCEELCLIHKCSQMCKNKHVWDKAYISEKDVIFPVANQLNWWQDKTQVIQIPGGHYPFLQFKNWEEVVGIQ